MGCLFPVLTSLARARRDATELVEVACHRGSIATRATVLLLLLSASALADPVYRQWSHGPSADPAYFPIAVWLQPPRLASRYKDAGFNVYVGLWNGPTEEQLSELKKQGMQLFCEQNEVGLAHKDDPTIIGWMHGDEPDNAQEKRGGGYGPFIKPQVVQQWYARKKQIDPSRPIMLNLGQGVANDNWHGRGSGAKLDDYVDYVKGGDIISFDVYPVRHLSPDLLWYVPKGINRLKKWTGGQKIIWNCIECTRGDKGKATPSQVKSEVWMSIIHGSHGLIYFVHQFEPKFNEHALLDDPQMLSAVTGINDQIRELAAVINSPPAPDLCSVDSSSKDVPIDVTARNVGGSIYVFAVGMRNAPATAAFSLRDLAGAREAEVIGEDRRIELKDGRFNDNFEPFAVHLYRIQKQ